MRENISVAIITLNEEKNLPKCLQSITWADEIIVVDCGSIDNTVEIAKNAGARVYHIPWPGYAKQWENAINLCTNPWVLILAADGVIEVNLAQEIQDALISPGNIRGFILQYKHYFLGKWIKHCGWYPAPALRIIRKDSLKVLYREVHEEFTVNPYLVIKLSNGHIKHYSYHSINQYIEKFNRYTDLDAKELAKSNPSLSAKDLVESGLLKFNEMYIQNQGYKDGLHGLVLCVLSGLYEFVARAKCLEIQNKFKATGE